MIEKLTTSLEHKENRFNYLMSRRDELKRNQEKLSLEINRLRSEMDILKNSISAWRDLEA